VLREPALPASGAMDGKAQAASRERRPWKADASVRRRGTGDPKAERESRIGKAQRASSLARQLRSPIGAKSRSFSPV